MSNVPEDNISKSDRAAMAAERIRAASDKTGDIWSFVSSVLDYVRR